MNKALVTGSGTNITNITNFTNFRYKKRRCGNHWIVSGTVANELQVIAPSIIYLWRLNVVHIFSEKIQSD